MVFLYSVHLIDIVNKADIRKKRLLPSMAYNENVSSVGRNEGNGETEG